MNQADTNKKDDILMDVIQSKKQQMDDEAIRIIEKADRDAIVARQLMADEEAENMAVQVQKDAQK